MTFEEAAEIMMSGLTARSMRNLIEEIKTEDVDELKDLAKVTAQIRVRSAMGYAYHYFSEDLYSEPLANRLRSAGFSVSLPIHGSSEDLLGLEFPELGRTFLVEW